MCSVQHLQYKKSGFERLSSVLIRYLLLFRTFEHLPTPSRQHSQAEGPPLALLLSVILLTQLTLL